ncbi:hypothetical protein [Diplocloster agilis]
MLSQQSSFKQIASAVGKNCTSISREVRIHLEYRRSGGYGRSYNACLHRRDCSISFLFLCQEKTLLPLCKMQLSLSGL